MMRQLERQVLREVNIFLACPNNVAEERNAIERVIGEYNENEGRQRGLSLRLLQGTTNAVPGMGRPEAVILNQIAIEKMDIFLGVLWHRFGSQTGAINTTSGGQYESGTEEEFQLAYASFVASRTPKIMFYRTRRQADLKCVDPQQLAHVNDFYNDFRPDGAHPGLLKDFDNAQDLERLFRVDLSRSLVQLFDVDSESPEHHPEVMLSSHFKQAGLHALFLPSYNVQRDEAKRRVLEKTSDMRLTAHSGHSYLASTGHQFRDVITRRLEQGAKLKVLLTDPWTLPAWYIAVNELDTAERNRLILDEPDKIIEESSWFRFKLRNSFAGYAEMRTRFAACVEVRLTDWDMPASILLTETDGFLEPYMHMNRATRLQQQLITFDVQFDHKADLFAHSSTAFDALWEDGIPYEKWVREQVERRECLKPLLSGHIRRRLNDLVVSGVIG